MLAGLSAGMPSRTDRQLWQRIRCVPESLPLRNLSTATARYRSRITSERIATINYGDWAVFNAISSDRQRGCCQSMHAQQHFKRCWPRQDATDYFSGGVEVSPSEGAVASSAGGASTASGAGDFTSSLDCEGSASVGVGSGVGVTPDLICR